MVSAFAPTVRSDGLAVAKPCRDGNSLEGADKLDDIAGAHDFDFEFHTWDIVNKRRKKPSLYDHPETNKDLEWEEFPAVGGMAQKMLDGRVVIDHYDATFPNSEIRQGITVRAFDPATGLWSFA